MITVRISGRSMPRSATSDMCSVPDAHNEIGDQCDCNGTSTSRGCFQRSPYFLALATATGLGRLGRGSVRAGCVGSDERELPAYAPGFGAQPGGQGAALAVRLVRQLRQGAD